MTVDQLSWLVRSGLFGTPGELVGIGEHGAAVICGPGRVPIVRLQGPRPAGTEVAPIALGCYGSAAEEAQAMRHQGRQRSKKV
jgi:hypothetical protein